MGPWPHSDCFSTEGVRSGTGTLALPSSGELMGSSSSEHGSISPDSDAQPDAFFEKVQVPKHQLSHLLRYYHCPSSPCGGPLKGAGCSSALEHLLYHRKGFCREQSSQGDMSSPSVPFLSFLFSGCSGSSSLPSPTTLPLSCLLFPLCSLPPCPFPLPLPSLLAPYLLISLP